MLVNEQLVNSFMSSLTTNLALYVLSLEDAASRNLHQDDESLYRKFRAHAGYMLALSVIDEDKKELTEALEAHEGLWLSTMLADEVYQGPAEIWQDIRQDN